MYVGIFKEIIQCNRFVTNNSNKTVKIMLFQHGMTNYFIRLACFPPFVALINTHFPHFCFASCGLLLLFHHPATLYEKKWSELTMHLPIPLPSETIRLPSLSFCFSYLHSASQTGFPLLKALESIHVTSNRKLVVQNSNQHPSEGNRALAPSSMLKNLRKRRLSPGANSDYDQHVVIYSNDKM